MEVISQDVTNSGSSKRSAPSSSNSKCNNKRRRDGSDNETPQCKTCSYCRVKKMKCDSSRPSCKACEVNNIQCEYPRDTRRLTRPSQSRLDDLEAKINGIWEFISAANILAQTPSRNAQTPSDPTTSQLTDVEITKDSALLASGSIRSSICLPSPGSHIRNESMDHTIANAGHLNEAFTSHTYATHNVLSNATKPFESEKTASRPLVSSMVDHLGVYTGAPSNDEHSLRSDLSAREARIAGLDVGQDGIISVHGPSSMMHHDRSDQNANTPNRDAKINLKASRARLISYAVIQRQTEAFIFTDPTSKADLDGVDPELAHHLLDLHWNRQHYAYLLTYRPAIMDSLANGGPWCNKLLLNGMYYTSCLYSDRESLRASPGDTQSSGDRFYARFRALLMDEIMKPSLPSAAALLLTGAALVSQGRISAGWNFCGIGYRMITDMGCHIALNSRAPTGGDSSRDLSVDIENEWRRRLYFGALITDATQSMYLGRPMTLRFDEGRVPQLFLDTYEELEEWKPHIDETQPVDDNALLIRYRPKPAFAISTFTHLIRLAQISSTITQSFYSLASAKWTHDELVRCKDRLEDDLSRWRSELPIHLQFEPNVQATPPPHQITPHTTYHVLNILLRRPFLEGGHLQDHLAVQDKRTLEDHCISSALEIRNLISAYRDAFTLRRAPFLISYAVYSAIIVILRDSKRAPGQHQEPISFFLTALSDLQRNCNYGLRRPMAIIKSMVDELKDHGPHVNEAGVAEQPANGQFDLSAFPTSFGEPLDMQPDMSAWSLPSFDVSPEGFFDFDQGVTLPEDTLYGLLSFQAPAF